MRIAPSLTWLVALLASCGDPRIGQSPDGGAGGDGGVDGSTPAPLWCDDQNPCTDDRIEDGACRFIAVEDGRPCDDRDFCTLGDRCRAGTCVAGARSQGPLERIGALDSLGGGAIGAVGDRFLSISGPSWAAHVRLAERRGSDLQVVASWDGRVEFLLSDILGVAFDVLDDGLVVVGGRQDRSLAIFSIATSASEQVSIVKRADATLLGQLVSLTGHGKRIWACTRDFFRGTEVELIDVSDPGAPVIAGTLPLSGSCGSIDTSDDGKRVYLNTAAGVRFIDASPLDSGGVPTLSEVFAPPAGVTAAAGHLVLREAGAVRVLRQSDHAEVASIAERGVLAASLVGDRLVLEGWRSPPSGGMEAFAALYDALGAPPQRLDEVILQRVPFQGDVGPSFRNAVTISGSAMITGIARRLFDLSSGRFDEVRAPVLAPLNQLVRTSEGVRAVGFSSSAAVDVRAAQDPGFAGGGSFGAPVEFEAVLEDSPPGPQLYFGDRSDVPSRAGVGRSWEPNPLVVDRWQLDDSGRPRIAGSFRLANRGPTQLLTADGGLYGMRAPAAPTFAVALQGWPIAALGRAGELASPSFELSLVASPPLAASSGFPHSAFDVDPRARLAVVAIGASSISASDGALFWIDLATAPPTVVEQVRIDARPDEIRISGTRAVLSTGIELRWFERGKGQVARQRPTAQSNIEHLLGFDGRTAYYSLLDFTNGVGNGLGTSAFGEAGPALPALVTGDAAQTLVETDGGLVVGFPDQLLTVHPRCE